jgi:nucleotide-binding universal stress UspA family protein
MSVVVGYGPEARGRGGLELARALSLSAGLPLIVCCVVPDQWRSVVPGRHVDPDFAGHLHRQAERALEHAGQALGEVPDGVAYDVVTARSAPAGLLAAVERHGARMLVAGSSTDGRWGHVALGSVTDRLLHSSPVPVAVAPRGFRSRRDQRVERITVAVDGTEATRQVLERAADVSGDVGARLRVVVFAVRARTMFPPEVGLHVEDAVVEAWREEALASIQEALATLPGPADDEVEAMVAEAPTWGEALEEPGWTPGDVLVVGSSASQSLLSRVFLGSTATRIIRHSPVPVVVVP